MSKRTQRIRSVTESGFFPKPDLTLFTPKESDEPMPQPEAGDSDNSRHIPASMKEGEDIAKQQDDSAAGRKR